MGKFSWTLPLPLNLKKQSSGNFISEMHTYTILATFIKTSISQDSPKVIYDCAQPVFHIDRNVQTVFQVWASVGKICLEKRKKKPPKNMKQ